MQKIRVSENKILVYYTSAGQGKKLQDNKENIKMPETNKTKGILSKKASARLKNCITKLVESYTIGKYANKWRFFQKRLQMNFVTLTLPSQQIHSDKKIKRSCFSPFLQVIQEKYKVSCYVWRAEKQENGNLHFHIIINRNIHWSAIRQEWNRCIERLGYVTAYQQKFSKLTYSQYEALRGPKNDEEKSKIQRAFNRNKEENWSNPNSTDIHKIEKMTKITQYVSKYMTKNTNDENLKVEGHLWGRSDNLEEIIQFESIAGAGDLKKLERIQDTSHCLYYKDEYFEVYTLLDINIFDLCLSFTAKYVSQCQNNLCYLEKTLNSVQQINIV